MTDRPRHQLSLCDSVSDGARLEGVLAEHRYDRVLVSIPGYCDDVRREEIAGELNQVLRRLGHHLSILSLDDVDAGGRGHAGMNISSGGIVSYLGYFRALARKLTRCDILHLVFDKQVSLARGVIPSVFLAKFFGKKVILDYRIPVIFSPNAVQRFFIERLWRLCDRVLVRSAYQRQLVNSFGGAAEYIQAGVDLREITPRVITDLQPRILLVAELEREHNVASAVRAFKLVKQKYPRTEMTIVGTGSQQQALKDLVERERIYGITFAGVMTTKQRIELLESSDLYLNCSSVDYLSTATAEAFACGLPVLTTPLSGSGEVLRSRENIILLHYNDHVGAAERIIELMENPALTETLSRNSRRTGEGYSIGRRVDEWTRLYRCLLPHNS